MFRITQRIMLISLWITLLVAATPSFSAGQVKDLKITSPSPEFRVLMYDSKNCHIIYLDGEDYATSVMIAQVTNRGKVRGRQVLYELSQALGYKREIVGLSAIPIRNGYLVAIFTVLNNNNQIHLRVLRIRTNDTPLGGIGPTGKIPIRTMYLGTVATYKRAGRVVNDSHPVAETTMFGISPAGLDQEERRYAVLGAISLDTAPGARAFHVFAAAFTVTFESEFVFEDVKYADLSSGFDQYTDALPSGIGRGGMINDSAYWFFGAKGDATSSAPDYLRDRYLGKVGITKIGRFPSNTDNQIGIFYNDGAVVDDFAGFTTNRSRGFISYVRYHVEGAKTYPAYLLGYEVFEDGLRGERQYIAFDTLDEHSRPAKKATEEFQFIPGGALATVDEGFITYGALGSIASKKNNKSYSYSIQVFLWSLLGGVQPRQVFSAELPAEREVKCCHMVRAWKDTEPMYLVFSYLDHKAGDSKYKFSFMKVDAPE